MFTKQDKLDAIKQPHAYVWGHADHGYGHLYASITLDGEGSFSRAGSIRVHSQIGHSSTDMVRENMKRPESRIYAERLEYDGMDGLSTGRLKVVMSMLTRFEKDESRYQGFAQYMIAAFHAAKARWVFLQPETDKGHGINKVDCEMLDMRKPADAIRFAEYIARRRDTLWERVTPYHLRFAAERELAENA